MRGAHVQLLLRHCREQYPHVLLIGDVNDQQCIRDFLLEFFTPDRQVCVQDLFARRPRAKPLARTVCVTDWLPSSSTRSGISGEIID